MTPNTVPASDAATGGICPADVERLMADPSADARAEMAAKVAVQFEGRHLSPAERKIAEDIFRQLISDAEVRVREALAEHLKSATDLPHDVALSLANDVESVALPVLEFCQVLSDEDLIEIVRGHGPGKQEAVAKRAEVSARVADALIDTGNESAVAVLVTNEGAALDEGALSRVLNEYQGSEAVGEGLAGRPNLPAAVSEQLMGAITQQLQSYLMKQHDLPVGTVKKLVNKARERATVSLLREGCTQDEELEELIAQLHANGRLTSSIALKALSEGDITFFELSMARLANIPIENARALIHDQGKLGLKSIFKSIV